MNFQTQEKVNETIIEVCNLIITKIKSNSAEDHEQLPSLIKALADLTR